jgi:hypothetical protein
MAEEIPKRVHMAVRGAMGQQSSHAQIDGNYFPMPGVSVCINKKKRRKKKEEKK